MALPPNPARQNNNTAQHPPQNTAPSGTVNLGLPAYAPTSPPLTRSTRVGGPVSLITPRVDGPSNNIN